MHSEKINKLINYVSVNAAADEVNRICHPLFKNTPLTYFDYARFYDSGEMLYLGTSPEFLTTAFVRDLMPTKEELFLFDRSGLKATFLSHYMPLPPGASEVTAGKYDEIITCAADCNIFHRLYFIERESDYYRCCGFGVNSKVGAVFNFYINYMANLQKFIKHFESKTEYLMTHPDQSQQIILPDYHKKILENYQAVNSNRDKIILDFSCENTQLTIREKECLGLIAQGYTMKNAALKLGISHRTVEQHLRNIKDKLGISTKNQLVEIWHQFNKDVFM